MIAVIDARKSLVERVQRIERTQRDPRRTEPLEKSFVGGERADRVVQHMDAHPAGRCGREQGAQRPVAGGGFLKNETLDQQVFARRFDGREHRLISTWAVDEQLDAIAGKQWWRADV